MTENRISIRTACAPAALLLTGIALGPGSMQDLLAERRAAHAAAANEAIAWSGHTAEVVNVGLTAREHAIVNAAMFEAANAITRRYEPYALKLAPEPGASIDAAVATAAHHALVVVWPRAAELWNQLYVDSMSRLVDAPAKTKGIAVGKAAAEGILASRANDTPFPGPSFTPKPASGVWRPNPPELSLEEAGTYAAGLGLPALTAYAYWWPWTLSSPAQFRPGPPPALNSAEYAKDLNEVKILGAFASRTRTADQTAEALFFMTPAPRIYGPFAHDLANRRGLDATDATRLLTLLSVALVDSQIACWDAKLAFAQWRPLTAIREAGGDGNPATVPDPKWIPRVPTPPFPDYPAGHSCSAGAAAEVLRPYVENGQAITLRSPRTGTPPGSGETRQYANFDAVVEAVANARVWAGVHFRTSCVVGNEIGAKVGRWVRTRALKPLNGGPGSF